MLDAYFKQLIGKIGKKRGIPENRGNAGQTGAGTGNGRYRGGAKNSKGGNHHHEVIGRSKAAPLGAKMGV
jgi:hypothetical protein